MSVEESLKLILFQFDTGADGQPPTGVYAVPDEEKSRQELFDVIRKLVEEADCPEPSK